MFVGHNLSMRIGDGPEMESFLERKICWFHQRYPYEATSSCGCSATLGWRPKRTMLDAFAEAQLSAVVGNAD